MRGADLIKARQGDRIGVGADGGGSQSLGVGVGRGGIGDCQGLGVGAAAVADMHNHIGRRGDLVDGHSVHCAGDSDRLAGQLGRGGAIGARPVRCEAEGDGCVLDPDGAGIDPRHQACAIGPAGRQQRNRAGRHRAGSDGLDVGVKRLGR